MNSNISSAARHISRSILVALFLAYLLFVIVTLYCLLTLDHQTLSNWFKGQAINAYQISDFEKSYFTPLHLRFIKGISPWIMICLVCIIVTTMVRWKISQRYLENFVNEILWACVFVLRSLRSLSIGQKFILISCLTLLLIIKAFLFVILPFSVDEVFNFVFFANKGFFVTTTFSNNHVLYNLLSALPSKVGLEPLLACRITSIIAGMSVHLVIFVLVRHFYSFKIGVWTMMLTGVTMWGNVFSTIGTTYMLTTLCWLVALSALIRIIKSQGVGGYYVFIFSSVMGMYGSKMFVIPLAGLVITWICLELNGRTLKTVIIKIACVSFAIVTFTVLLYLPMYLWSGREAVFVTRLVPHSFTNHFPLLLEIMSVATDINSKTYIVFGVCLILSIIFYKHFSNKLKFIFTLSIANVIALWLFILTMHVYPPSRGLVYLNIIFFGILALGISEVLEKSVALKRRSHAFYGIMIGAKIFASIYIFKFGWQAETVGGIQDRRFYDRLTDLSKCIVSTKPSMIYEDRHDGYLGFYVRLAAVRETHPLTFHYNINHAQQCDIHIIYDGPNEASLKHEQVVSGEFGDVLMKRNMIGKSIKSVCFKDWQEKHE